MRVWPVGVALLLVVGGLAALVATREGTAPSPEAPSTPGTSVASMTGVDFADGQPSGRPPVPPAGTAHATPGDSPCICARRDDSDLNRTRFRADGSGLDGLTLTWDAADLDGRPLAHADGVEFEVPATDIPRPIFVRVQAHDARGTLAATDVVRTVAPESGLAPGQTSCDSTCAGFTFSTLPGVTSVEVVANPLFMVAGQDTVLPPSGMLTVADPAGRVRATADQGRFTPAFDVYVWDAQVDDLAGLPGGTWTATWAPSGSFQGDIDWSVRLDVEPAELPWPTFSDGWSYRAGETAGAVVTEPFGVYAQVFPHRPVFGRFAPERVDLRMGFAHRDFADQLDVKSYGLLPPGDRVTWQVFDANATLLATLEGRDPSFTAPVPGPYTARVLVHNGTRLVAWGDTTFAALGRWVQPLACPTAASETAPCTTLSTWVPAGGQFVQAIVTPRAPYDPFLPMDPTEAQLVLRDPAGVLLGSDAGHTTPYGTYWQFDTTLSCATPAGRWTLAWEPQAALGKGDSNYGLTVVFCDKAAKQPPPPAR